jgi:hypothetical protein
MDRSFAAIQGGVAGGMKQVITYDRQDKHGKNLGGSTHARTVLDRGDEQIAGA